jgi:uncharacterized surface protein with fasciclin (FAS1) repeats
MKTSRFRLFVTAVAASTALAVSAGPALAASGDTSSKPTVAEIAASSDDFSTLVTAVTAAGLGETLSGNGPFTVFAPTNEAFAKIPPAQLQAILADRALLTKILTYHVVPDRVLSKDLKKRQSVDTVEGNAVEIVKKKKGAFIEDARITQTDLKGRNGVVHVIDTVILPPDV